MYPAAEAIQEAFARDGQKLSDLEAMFAETILWYDSEEKLTALPYDPEAIEILKSKMNDARAEKDYRTADSVRKILTNAGIVVKNK